MKITFMLTDGILILALAFYTLVTTFSLIKIQKNLDMPAEA